LKIVYSHSIRIESSKSGGEEGEREEEGVWAMNLITDISTIRKVKNY